MAGSKDRWTRPSFNAGPADPICAMVPILAYFANNTHTHRYVHYSNYTTGRNFQRHVNGGRHGPNPVIGLNNMNMVRTKPMMLGNQVITDSEDLAMRGLAFVINYYYYWNVQWKWHVNNIFSRKTPVDHGRHLNKPARPIPPDNVGHILLCKMGWMGGGLGKHESGMQEPIKVTQLRKRVGLGFALELTNSVSATDDLKTQEAQITAMDRKLSEQASCRPVTVKRGRKKRKDQPKQTLWRHIAFVPAEEMSPNRTSAVQEPSASDEDSCPVIQQGVQAESSASDVDSCPAIQAELLTSDEDPVVQAEPSASDEDRQQLQDNDKAPIESKLQTRGTSADDNDADNSNEDDGGTDIESEEDDDDDYDYDSEAESSASDEDSCPAIQAELLASDEGSCPAVRTEPSASDEYRQQLQDNDKAPIESKLQTRDTSADDNDADNSNEDDGGTDSESEEDDDDDYDYDSEAEEFQDCLEDCIQDDEEHELGIDIQDLREENEKDMEWELRQYYIQSNKGSLPLEEVVAQSRILVEIVMHRRCYPEPIMKEMRERSHGLLDQVEQARQGLRRSRYVLV